MKYIVVLGDGMADWPIDELGGKTPLEYAKTGTLDDLAGRSEIGLVKTIPEGMKPGSDTANLAVLGYDPKIYYSGRSPLEALSIGVNMKSTDIAIRCNIVTVSDDELPYEDKTILDHSSSEISTEDAAVLLDAVKRELESDRYQFYVGTSYRHLLIWDRGEVVDLTPPHDILGKSIGGYLPADTVLREMMKKSYDILNHHPLNVERAKKGLHKANSIWFWGAGTKPALTSFEEKTGKKGAMISAVDLLKGIAVGAEMKVIEVKGANGTLHTNYEGKAEAAVQVLLDGGCDFVYIHVEAPDEMGHQGSISNKVQSIEFLDNRLIRIVRDQMEASGVPYRMLVMPDHPTPIAVRTHTSDPVPYLLYDSTRPYSAKSLANEASSDTGVREKKKVQLYNEKEAAESGILIENGYQLIDRLLQI